MGRPREFDEAKVVEDAMQVFWRRGFQATSVQDLVDATGLQRGSLYGAFGDKHGLFLAALERYMADMDAFFDQSITQADDPVEGLREFVRGGAAKCANRAMAERGCMVGNACNEMVSHDPLARARVHAFVSRTRRTMAAGLRRGQEIGTFDADRDPEAVANFIQCSLQGLTLLAKSRPGPKVIAGVIDEILRVLD